jgi:adenylate kinase
MIVILTGAPGAGKGTQADLLASRRGVRKLSTGDALRKHVKLGTPIGKVAGAVMERGDLVSNEILLDILKEELKAIDSGEIVLLDGYPRNIAQAESLDIAGGLHKIGVVIHLDVERQDLISRLSGRQVCGSCGASFHKADFPSKKDGVCDRCGGNLYQRPDDSPDSVAKRLDVYDQSTKPVLDFYQKKGLYQKVDGTGSPEEIYSRLEAYIERL